ncbi:uncharacterized protein LOC142336815 isoform X2 [Convolutriloba macropyga]
MNLRSSSIIGFPTITNLTTDILADIPKLWTFIRSGAKDCSVISNCSDVENFLYLNESSPKFTVRVVRNESLVKERYKNLNSSKDAVNVLILLVDALSRQGFKRSMPRTFALFEKWNLDPDLNVIPFPKFSSFGAYTEPNMVPFIYGVDYAVFNAARKIAKKVPLYSLFEEAETRGYVTGYTHTSCQVADFEWKPFLPNQISNHDHRLTFCDPNFIETDDPFNPTKGPYSIFKRCMYGRQIHEYTLDYLFSFWQSYPDLPKLFMINFSDAHESTAEQVSEMDENLKQFLIKIRKQNWFSNTALFLMSDHGNHMHFIFQLLANLNLRLETHDPLLIAVTPKKLANISAIYHNARQLATMHDLRKTILNLIGKSGKDLNGLKGVDLFNQIVAKNRTCNKAQIQKSCCRCT